MNLQQIIDSGLCESTTGCEGAGDFKEWAAQQGYDLVEVMDWTSSAGDWCFVVSDNDGAGWVVMSQENNYPRRGFTRTIYEDNYFEGTAEEAIEYFSNN